MLVVDVVVEDAGAVVDVVGAGADVVLVDVGALVVVVELVVDDAVVDGVDVDVDVVVDVGALVVVVDVVDVGLLVVVTGGATVMTWVTVGAESYASLPGWSALMMQVPAPTHAIVAPLLPPVVHTVGVDVENETVSGEVVDAVAVRGE